MLLKHFDFINLKHIRCGDPTDKKFYKFEKIDKRVKHAASNAPRTSKNNIFKFPISNARAPGSVRLVSVRFG